MLREGETIQLKNQILITWYMLNDEINAYYSKLLIKSDD